MLSFRNPKTGKDYCPKSGSCEVFTDELSPDELVKLLKHYIFADCNFCAIVSLEESKIIKILHEYRHGDRKFKDPRYDITIETIRGYLPSIGNGNILTLNIAGDLLDVYKIDDKDLYFTVRWFKMQN